MAKRHEQGRHRTRGSEIVARSREIDVPIKTLHMFLSTYNAGLPDKGSGVSFFPNKNEDSIERALEMVVAPLGRKVFQYISQNKKPEEQSIFGFFLLEGLHSGVHLQATAEKDIGIQTKVRTFSSKKKVMAFLDNNRNSWQKITTQVPWPMEDDLARDGISEIPLAETARTENDEPDTTVVTHLSAEGTLEILEALDRPAQASESLVEAFRRRAQRKS